MKSLRRYCLTCKKTFWIEPKDKVYMLDTMTNRAVPSVRCPTCKRIIRISKRKPEKYCAHCQEPLPSHFTKYCSAACHDAATNNIITASCVVCNRDFTYVLNRGKYKTLCSRECELKRKYAAARTHKKILRIQDSSKEHPRNCMMCGKVFVPPNTLARRLRFCSQECRHMAALASQRAGYRRKRELILAGWRFGKGGNAKEPPRDCKNCGKSFVPLSTLTRREQCCSEECRHMAALAVLRAWHKKKRELLLEELKKPTDGIPRPVGPVQLGTGNRSEEGNREQKSPT